MVMMNTLVKKERLIVLFVLAHEAAGIEIRNLEDIAATLDQNLELDRAEARTILSELADRGIISEAPVKLLKHSK